MTIGDPSATLEGLRAADRGEEVVFCEVGPGLVSPVERTLANATLGEACAGLGIEPPQLRWFDAENAGHRAYAERYGWRDWCWWPGDPLLLGLYVRPFHEIWLRCDLEPIEVVRTVAHECAHAAQDPFAGDREQREQAAEDFAHVFASAFTN